ncbi:hypothetical protein [Micromonospora sp. NPDC047074]|uniref:hypothetical protein n=1 Tax=Micromonospora sp. NPDC047074 TaxID=3154339 RepID=UPI0033E10C34
MAAEVRSHASVLAYTAAMSTAATDALGSLESAIAAMGLLVPNSSTGNTVGVAKAGRSPWRVR